MAELEGKYYEVEESENPKLLKRVPQLRNDLYALGRLMEALKSPKRQIRAGRQVVVYLMGDTSGLGFGSILWGQGILSSKSREFYPLYQGRWSNSRVVENLTTRI